MDTIGVQDLWSFQDNRIEAIIVNCQQVRQSQGHRVSDYLELAGKVAELQFRNRDYVFLYRGQLEDHLDYNGQSTLRPAIFRTTPEARSGDVFPIRFRSLETVERVLVEHFRAKNLIGSDELTRHRILRWSILQHYEVHPTPLLDVTQSLRIAASFASLRNKTEEAFLYVLGVPNISGAISASAEAGLQIIRLSSVCPPSAMRPHVQEGYLVGEYPEISNFEQKQLYGLPEIDFGKRLVAKFRFNPQEFWSKKGQFQKIGPQALYPSSKRDQLSAIAEKIKANPR